MKLSALVAAMGLAALSSCSDDVLNGWGKKGNTTLTASIDDARMESRTCIDPKSYSGNVTGVLWTPDDCLGVFGDASTKNAQFTNVETTNVAKASFTGDMVDGESPLYAYYPYSAGNNGNDPSELSGTVSAEQTFSLSTGLLTDDWKYGTLKESTSSGYEFKMNHLFALAKVTVNATGSPVEGETLESIEVTLPEGRQLRGDFTFSAVDGSYTLGTCTNSVKMVWSDKPDLISGKSYTGYLTLIPEGVKENDKITICLTTNKHTATYEVKCLCNFASGYIYNFPLTLTTLADKMKAEYGTEPTITEIPTEPGTPDPSEPTVTTGTFTACAFNVDGLPKKIGVFTINGDGPGESGTTTMAGIANNLGWDIIAASEDFEYHSQLETGLSNYNAGTYRGTITSAQLTSRANTDGLCFFWKKGLTVTSEGNSPGSDGWEKMVQYTNEYGGLSGGANTCIKKGFRHYEVEFAEGVVVDVYITHMNTYSGTNADKYLAAQIGQLCEIRDYVLKKAKENKRPAIIMGDTNMRYTRHDIKANFLDVVAAYDNNAGYTVSDPWAELVRGVYPTYGTKSLMIRAHANKDGISSDIICADDQRGEVVDKIWYINVPGAEVQIEATSHKNDIDNFKTGTSSVTFSGATLEDANGNITENKSITYDKVVGYSDHFPVVTTFQWTKTTTTAK